MLESGVAIAADIEHEASREADAAAKGQQDGDPWQLATNIVWQLTAGARVAA